MKIKESKKGIKEKTEKDLKALVAEKQKALKDFRFSLSVSKVKNIKQGKFLKKDIARAFTFIRQQKGK